jgi:hypothetical protein
MNCSKQREIHAAPNLGERTQRNSKRNFEGDENHGFGFDGYVSC